MQGNLDSSEIRNCIFGSDFSEDSQPDVSQQIFDEPIDSIVQPLGLPSTFVVDEQVVDEVVDEVENEPNNDSDVRGNKKDVDEAELYNEVEYLYCESDEKTFIDFSGGSSDNYEPTEVDLAAEYSEEETPKRKKKRKKAPLASSTSLK